MFSEAQFGEVLERALKRGGDFADIFIERKRFTGITCEDSKIEAVNSGYECGAGVRVLHGESTTYAYTNELSMKGLLEAAELAGKAAAGGAALTFDLSRASPRRPQQIGEDPRGVPVEEKASAVEAINKAARDFDPRIRQVKVSYSDSIQEVLIANSRGSLVEDTRTRTRISATAIASEGGVTQTGTETKGQHSGFELLRAYPPEEIGAQAARRAIAALEAQPAPAGRMRVVLAGEAGGTIIHEACGHGLEGDLALKKLSVYAEKLEQPVASELVTVVDDGSLPNYYGSSGFDDEGAPTGRTVLIDRGVLKGYMLDMVTSRIMEASPTGNGRRESYRHRPIVRMTNTYVERGTASPEDIIRETKHGLLVKQMGGGQVNTTNGDFVFHVTEAYLINDGDVGPAVRGASLTGNGPKALRQVEMVGNDLGFAIGTCGKDGQGVPVSDGLPTMSIGELIVGGSRVREATGKKIVHVNGRASGYRLKRRLR